LKTGRPVFVEGDWS